MKLINSNLITLWDEFDIDDFLNNKNTAFVTVGYKDKDGQGYSSAQILHRKSLRWRKYEVYAPDHYLTQFSKRDYPEANPAGMGNLISITITDTLFDRKTWKAKRPLKLYYSNGQRK